jgi:hypothetical protein
MLKADSLAALWMAVITNPPFVVASVLDAAMEGVLIRSQRVKSTRIFQVRAGEPNLAFLRAPLEKKSHFDLIPVQQST